MIYSGRAFLFSGLAVNIGLWLHSKAAQSYQGRGERVGEQKRTAEATAWHGILVSKPLIFGQKKNLLFFKVFFVHFKNTVIHVICKRRTTVVSIGLQRDHVGPRVRSLECPTTLFIYIRSKYVADFLKPIHVPLMLYFIAVLLFPTVSQ